jgi:hypothetical protein
MRNQFFYNFCPETQAVLTKKKQSIWIFCLFFVFLMNSRLANSQTVQARGFVIQSGGTGRDVINAVDTLSDGYIFAGSTDSQSLTSREIIVIRADLTGQIIWSKIYGGNGHDEATDIEKTNDGGFVVTGYSKSFTGTGTDNFNAFLMKINGSGVVQWGKCYGGMSDEIAYSVMKTSGGGYIITGYTNSFGNGGSDVLFIKTDANGTPTILQAVGGASTEIGKAVIETSGGEFMINGSTNGFGSAGPVTHFMKLSNSGTVVWSKKLFYNWNGPIIQTGNGLIENSNGQFVFTGTSGTYSGLGAGSAILFQADNSGNVTWAYDYGFNSGVSCGYEVRETNSGYRIFGYMGNYVPIAFTTNSAGVFSYVKLYYSTSFNPNGRGFAGKPTADGGYIMAGMTYSPSSSDTNQIVIKADASGNTPCYLNTGNLIASGTGTTITATNCSAISGGTFFPVNLTESVLALPTNTICNNLTPTGINEENKLNNLSFYPNPFSKSFALTINGAFGPDIKLLLFDINGRIVKQLNNIQPGKTQINIEDIERGIYFYQLSDGDGIISKGKIVAE